MDPYQTAQGPGAGMSASDDAGLAADVRWLRNFAARIVRDPDLADEACQEAWLGALKDGSPATERKDLARRAWRFLFVHWRGERRRRSREQEVAGRDASLSVDELLMQNEQQQRLWAELARLDEPFKTTLLLRFQGELDTAAIAARTDAPRDTVRWRIREGIRLIRQRLAADERGGGLAALVLVAQPWAQPWAHRPQPPIAAAHGLGSLAVLLMTKKIAACLLIFAAIAAAFSLRAEQPPVTTELAVVPDVEEAQSAPPQEEPRADAPIERRAIASQSPAEEAEPKASRSVQRSAGPPVLKLQLRPKGGARLPPTVTVAVTPYAEGFDYMGEPDKQTVSTEAGTIELEINAGEDTLELLQMTATRLTMGTVTVTADGFGVQESNLVSIDWDPGGSSEVTMDLDPATAARVSCVAQGSGESVEDLRIVVEGPSRRFRQFYRSKKGSPITLQLMDHREAEDQLYITASGVALTTISRTELLALPVQDGTRRIELSAGYRLTGHVELASGLPVPEGSELHYDHFQRGPDGKAIEHSSLIRSNGRAPIAEDGWFEIERLPESLLRLHLREEGPMRFNTKRLSHNFDVDIPHASDDLRIVIPEDQWKLKLDLSWALPDPFGSGTLVVARLYQAQGEEDLPYSKPLSERLLLATSDLISAKAPGDLVLPAGLIDEGVPYLLTISASARYCIQRRILFEGPSPEVTVHSAAVSNLELNFPPLPAETDLDEYAAKVQAARERGAAIVLEAITPR